MSPNPFNNSGEYLSQIELDILRSNVPIEIEESEEVTVMGHKGYILILIVKNI